MYLQQEVYYYSYNIYPILEIGGIKKIKIYTCVAHVRKYNKNTKN